MSDLTHYDTAIPETVSKALDEAAAEANHKRLVAGRLVLERVQDDLGALIKKGRALIDDPIAKEPRVALRLRIPPGVKDKLDSAAEAAVTTKQGVGTLVFMALRTKEGLLERMR